MLTRQPMTDAGPSLTFFSFYETRTISISQTSCWLIGTHRWVSLQSNSNSEKNLLWAEQQERRRRKKITKSSSFHIFKILSQDWSKLQIGCMSGRNHFFHLKLSVNLFFIWRPEFFFVFQKIRLGNKVFFPGSGKPKYLLEFFRPSFASFRSISRLSNEIVTDERRWEVQVRNKKGEKNVLKQAMIVAAGSGHPSDVL